MKIDQQGKVGSSAAAYEESGGPEASGSYSATYVRAANHPTSRRVQPASTVAGDSRDERMILSWLKTPVARSLERRWVALGDNQTVLAVGESPRDLSGTIEHHPNAAVVYVLPDDVSVTA